MLRKTIIPILSLASFLATAPLQAHAQNEAACSAGSGMQPGENRILKIGRPEAYTRGIHTEPGTAAPPMTRALPYAMVQTGRPEGHTRGLMGGFGREFRSDIAWAPHPTGSRARPGRPETFTRGIVPDQAKELACPVFLRPKVT